MKKLIILLIIAFQTIGVFAQKQRIIEDNLKTEVYFLASNWLKGREPGTKGERLAADHIEEVFESLNLEPAGKKKYRQYFKYKTKKSPHDTTFTGPQKKGINLIAFLDNDAEKTIVIGAHYDHLGKNGHGSSLDKNNHQIHNGADDNASGTAGVLELARYYSTNKQKEKCNFLFICFSGEEDGLIGSKYFTNHPTIDLSKVKCMINMDMIGRLNDSTNKLMVYGVGTSPAFELVFKDKNGGFNLVFDSSGIGPSDQTSFYLKNIPVLHFFTGQHSDYHKSTDDAEKLNYKGEVKVLEYILDLNEVMISLPEMTFTPTRNKEETKVSFKVTLGIMPDYTYEGEGIRVDATTEGKPAHTAGIKAGDIILQLGEHTTNGMPQYMKALSAFSKGETTDVIVKRGQEKITLKVTF